MFPDLALANPGTVVVATAALAAYHAISYLVNYVDGAEFEHVAPSGTTESGSRPPANCSRDSPEERRSPSRPSIAGWPGRS